MSLNPLNWLQNLFTARALEIENARLNREIAKLEAQVKELEAKLRDTQQELEHIKRGMLPWKPLPGDR